MGVITTTAPGVDVDCTVPVGVELATMVAVSSAVGDEVKVAQYVGVDVGVSVAVAVAVAVPVDVDVGVDVAVEVAVGVMVGVKVGVGVGRDTLGQPSPTQSNQSSSTRARVKCPACIPLCPTRKDTDGEYHCAVHESDTL